MDIIVPQIQPIQDTSTPTYNTFNEATFGAGSTQVKVNSDGFFVGGSSFESAPFSVNYEGTMIAISGSFGGTLVAASGSLGAITVGTNSWHVDSDGNMWWGTSTDYSGATIKISSAGYVNFTSGTFTGSLGSGVSISSPVITGGTITGSTLKATGGSGADVWIDSSDGQVKFYIGGAKIGYMSGGYSEGGDDMVEIQADEYIQLRSSSGSIFALAGNEFGVVAGGSTSFVCKNGNVEVYDDLVAFQPYYSFVNGTKEGGNSGTYYVATSSGGSANHKIKFAGGIMVDG